MPIVLVKGESSGGDGSMTRRDALGMLMAAGVSTFMAACGVGGSTYRYKMTVEVETPQGLRTGFAVRDVSYDFSGIKLPDSAGVSVKQRGEAVVVDLPGRQTLFALLPVNAYEPLQAAFGNDAPATLNAARSDRRLVELRPKPNTLPEQSGYPMLVRFHDIADPKTVEKVDPVDLATAFGQGTRLRRITVQMVEQPVTADILDRLKWLKIQKGSLDYSTDHLHPDHPEKDLTQSAFYQMEI